MATEDEAGESTRMVAPALRERVRQSHSHLLEITEGAATRRFALSGDLVVLGRGADADFRIDSDELSRKHAWFRRRGTEYVCHDLDSRNGVFLNGLRVHSAVLRDGDIIELGTVVIVYRDRF